MTDVLNDISASDVSPHKRLIESDSEFDKVEDDELNLDKEDKVKEDHSVEISVEEDDDDEDEDDDDDDNEQDHVVAEHSIEISVGEEEGGGEDDDSDDGGDDAKGVDVGVANTASESVKVEAKRKTSMRPAQRHRPSFVKQKAAPSAEHKRGSSVVVNVQSKGLLQELSEKSQTKKMPLDIPAESLHVKGMLLNFAFIFSVTVAAIFPKAIAFAVVAAAAYYAEAFSCGTFKYLTKIKTDEKLYDVLKKFIDTPPEVYFQATCYHSSSDTEKVAVLNGQGEVVIEERPVEENEVSRTAIEAFPYSDWEDTSSKLSDILPQRSGVVRLTLYSDVECGDEQTEEAHRRQFEAFLSVHGSADEAVTINSVFKVPLYQKRTLLVHTGQTDDDDIVAMPFWLNPVVYVAATVFGMSWFFRMGFELLTTKVRFLVRKRVYYRHSLDALTESKDE